MIINPDILEMEYAVRGPIPQRAAVLRGEGRTIIPCNLGNPQAFGQRPLTYVRQVLSLLEDPSGIARERRLADLENGGSSAVPADILDRCEGLLAQVGTGMGAYTDSSGRRFIKEAIARFIDARDGEGAVPSDPDRIFLTDGASEGARLLLEMLIAGREDGILVPIPQYPLYSATIKKCGGVQVGYYPDEDGDWRLDQDELEVRMTEAKRNGVRVKAIVIINPGNPTGAVLDRASVEGMVDFAERHELLIIADEVYQENCYGAQFHSFARAVGKRDIPLASLHSTSKGFIGECGHRGGYLELRNPAPVQGTDLDLADVLLKQASVSLCSNTAGQLMTYLMVSPPEEGSGSHAPYVRERDGILADLHAKATRIRAAFEGMDGMRCFGRIGAMYLFPRMEKLPAGATDFDYCMALLEETGLCVVNGSGFGQKPGTHHLRIAFLPPAGVLEEVLPRWTAFHNEYVG
jgi:aspartate/methionine/tyrosine aminotransferase